MCEDKSLNNLIFIDGYVNSILLKQINKDINIIWLD